MYLMNVKKTKIIDSVTKNYIRLFEKDIEYVNDAYAKVSINAVAIADLMCLLYQARMIEYQVQEYVDQIKKILTLK